MTGDDKTRQIEEVLKPQRKVTASPGFKERVMREAVVEDRARVWFPRWAWVAAAAVVLLLAIPFVRTENGAATVLAESARGWSEVRSVHMTGKVRSSAVDSFDNIMLDEELVPLKIWKEFGPTERWRIEKPQRVAVMNGAQATMIYGSAPWGVRGGPDSGFAHWLKPLLDPEKVLERELAAVRFDGAAATVREAGTAVELTVARKARGDYRNAWALNKSITGSDHTCVYRFDAVTKRLVSLEVRVQSAGRETTVLAMDSIRYNEAADPALFTLQVPEKVVWALAPEDMPVTSQRLPANPKETAERFFTALAQEDWAAYLTVTTESEVPALMKERFGGLTVISIGEPFQSGLRGGWFVPYEIRLKNGYVKKFNLAVRNDNPAKRWYVDGGY